jgi:hypothetical protein
VNIKIKSKQPWYLTTSIPYVNAQPHVGFALELKRTRSRNITVYRAMTSGC